MFAFFGYYDMDVLHIHIVVGNSSSGSSRNDRTGPTKYDNNYLI